MKAPSKPILLLGIALMFGSGVWLLLGSWAFSGGADAGVTDRVRALRPALAEHEERQLSLLERKSG